VFKFGQGDPRRLKATFGRFFDVERSCKLEESYRVVQKAGALTMLTRHLARSQCRDRWGPCTLSKDAKRYAVISQQRIYTLSKYHTRIHAEAVLAFKSL
jgi:hypothetical protein